jgi:hypothetical protein
VKLKLVQSGGIAGKTMVAEASAKLKEKDFEALVNMVKKQKGRGKAKDAQHYTLQKSGDDKSAVSIDLESIPPSHNELFKKLFDNLRPEE